MDRERLIPFDIEPDVSKNVDNKRFQVTESLTIREAHLIQFLRPLNQLVVTAETWSRGKSLSALKYQQCSKIWMNNSSRRAKLLTLCIVPIEMFV